jgi:uncharacterized protein YdiU (UPF0061 family)
MRSTRGTSATTPTTQGRYAFDRQPNIAHWNLYCLGQALLPLIGEPAVGDGGAGTFKTMFDARCAFMAACAPNWGCWTPEAQDRRH